MQALYDRARSLHMGHRALFLAGASLFAGALSAQTLLVADLDSYLDPGSAPFHVQDSTFRADLTAAGVTYTAIDVVDGANPPTFAQLNTYQQVIWFCGSDGTSLGFWNAEQDIRDYAYTGKKLWIIGQDLLYALYNAPQTFTSGDLAYDVMGIYQYLVQSYGNDGGEGCPQLDVDPAVAGHFAPTVSWVFSTLWWADGCTLVPTSTPIYNFGPGSYSLAGNTTMLRNADPGLLNVTSTLFNPTAINTTANRVQFIQQTLAYMNVFTGVEEHAGASFGFSSNPAHGNVAVQGTDLRRITVQDLRGAIVRETSANGTDRHVLDIAGLVPGVYLVTVTANDGSKGTRRLVVE